MGYPILYWHAHPKSFSWFSVAPLISALPEIWERIGLAAYVATTALYLAKELYFSFFSNGREHNSFFAAFSLLPNFKDHTTRSWLVGLLAVPQFTRYILDGFIWRLKERNSSWQKVVFQDGAST